jgi:hypothetical protein
MPPQSNSTNVWVLNLSGWSVWLFGRPADTDPKSKCGWIWPWQKIKPESSDAIKASNRFQQAAQMALKLDRVATIAAAPN